MSRELRELPAEKDEHVSRVDAVSGRFELGSVLVRDQSDDYGLCSALGDAGGDCVGVDVTDLAGLRAGVGRDKLVAGGDDCDIGSSEDWYVVDAERKQAADVLGPYSVSGSEQQVASADVFAGVYHVLARSDGPEHLD